MNNEIYSWQQPQWQLLLRRIKQQTMPHALLLSGAAGIGKSHFADVLVKVLLCNNHTAEGTACNHCKSCQLIMAGNHPDWIKIQPEEAGKAIKLEQIRYLREVVMQTPQQGKFKIIVLSPADAMNNASANALLKTLEEPSPNTLLILITERLAEIPATIRSRCQLMQFTAPTKELATQWLIEKNININDISLLLNLTQSAPLKALKLIESKEIEKRQQIFRQWYAIIHGKEDIVKIAQEWQAMNLLQILEFMISWLIDMIKWQLTHEEKYLINTDLKEEVKKLGDSCLIDSLYDYLNHLQKTKNLLQNQANINLILTIENMLIVGKTIFNERNYVS